MYDECRGGRSFIFVYFFFRLMVRVVFICLL